MIGVLVLKTHSRYFDDIEFLFDKDSWAKTIEISEDFDD